MASPSKELTFNSIFCCISLVRNDTIVLLLKAETLDIGDDSLMLLAQCVRDEGPYYVASEYFQL